MGRPALRAAAFLLLCLTLGACEGATCTRSGASAATGWPALPADPVAAGHAVGTAMATEKDAAKLASMLGALLEHAGVPVFAHDGKSARSGGRLLPGPRGLWIWETELDGIARATVAGDRAPFAFALRRLSTHVDAKRLEAVDFPAGLARVAASNEASEPDRMIAAALQEDLGLREKVPRPRPELDPAATMLVGAWANLHLRYASSPVAPARTANDLTGIPATGSRCGWMSGAIKAALGAKSFVGTVQDKVGTLNYVLRDKDIGAILDGVGDVQTQLGMADINAGMKIAEEIGQGIAGMAIAAFVTVDGKVAPDKVKYGDGPARYDLTVKSDFPGSKDDIDHFVDCLMADAPFATPLVSPLRDIPPKGPIKDVPIYWQGTGKMDPRHGTFSTESTATSGEGWSIDSLKKAAVQLGMEAAGGGVTDINGKAYAKFQVKPGRDQKKGLRKFERFEVDALVFPFPVGGSLVYSGSNIAFHRSIPLVLEIEVPMRYWSVEIRGDLRVTGGAATTGNVYHVDTVVPVEIQDDGSLKGSAVSDEKMDAPQQAMTTGGSYSGTGSTVVRTTIGGNMQMGEPWTANVKVQMVGGGGGATLHAMGATVHKTWGGIGDIAEGTALGSFTIPLEDGATKSIPYQKAFPMGTQGAGTLVVTMHDANGE